MEIQTTKIWKKTLVTLRMIYALTGEKMTSIMDRLATDELKRVKKGKKA
jgi:hypothetical protein